jgi:hypothetical protein
MFQWFVFGMLMETMHMQSQMGAGRRVFGAILSKLSLIQVIMTKCSTTSWLLPQEPEELLLRDIRISM